jgi:hypothetical protein
MLMRRGYYKLVGRKAVPVSMEEGFRAFKIERVAYDEVGEVRVSTVFLAIDHQWEEGMPPLLFETMIFGGEYDGYQQRCSTWEQAEQHHATTVALVRASFN